MGILSSMMLILEFAVATTQSRRRLLLSELSFASLV
jgi:hypothetical protein